MRRWKESYIQVVVYILLILVNHEDRENYLKALMETLTNKLLAKLHQEVPCELNARLKKYPYRSKTSFQIVCKMT